MDTVLIKTLQLILSLSLLVVLHEGGHFFFSKLFKVKVEKFFLFFDPYFHLFSTKDKWFLRFFPRFKDKETEYGVGWLPFGGYVKIAGMIDESMDTEQMKKPAQPWEFRSKPAWQRLLIMVGGVLVNFILALFIYSMILYTWGESYIKSEDAVYGLKFNEQAHKDGFVDGDIIVSIDGERVETFQTALLRDISNASTVTVLRNGAEVTLDMPGNMNLLEMLKQEPRYADYRMPIMVDSVLAGTPAMACGLKKGDVITSFNGAPISDYNDWKYQLLRLQDGLGEQATHADSVKVRMASIVINGKDSVNVMLASDFSLGFYNVPFLSKYKVTTKEYGFFESFPAGIKYGLETLQGYVNDLKYVFTKEGARSVGGFVTIGNLFPAQWDWFKFWNMTAFLSIILAFMNILPIPAFDGGHVLFLLYEVVTRRKPSEKFLERAQVAGMFFILALLIFANANDILRVLGF